MPGIYKLKDFYEKDNKQLLDFNDVKLDLKEF